MDLGSMSPSLMGGTPLQVVSADRVNQQREPSAMLSSLQGGGGHGHGHSRDSSVHDKITQFNNLATQSKQLERKTADAALKRAMLGREEAEAEMRRYRDEARLLRRHVEEGKERERRVGERLETVMENYGRAKETHAHTQALWEKEIRRARKETFKSQSVIVKLQEELKSARTAAKAAEDGLAAEKERSEAREQEAFAARYSLVGVQEQLEAAQERIRVLEQERDAFKTLAQSEEDVARLASEGRLPLPKSQEEEDEFASPVKKQRVVSLSVADVKTSAASEAEVEELTMRWQWEKKRADRASDHVEYLEAECHLRACVCMKSRPRTAAIGESRPDVVESVILVERATSSLNKSQSSQKKLRLDALKSSKRSEPRRSTIFVPEEGVFRTVSQEEAEAMDVPSVPARDETDEAADPTTPAPARGPEPEEFVRTPSVEPPSCALLTHPRTSLLSLLDAPHKGEPPMPLSFDIPIAAMPVSQEALRDALESELEPAPCREVTPRPEELEVELPEPETPADDTENTVVAITPTIASSYRQDDMYEEETVEYENDATEEAVPPPQQAPRPHTTAAHYKETITITKVPLREENTDPSLASRLLAMQRTPNRSGGNGPSFDVNNPALTPTMTREQALAQIRERRGRARSAMAGAVTPKRPGPPLGERRDASAPVGRVGMTGSVRKGVR